MSTAYCPCHWTTIGLISKTLKSDDGGWVETDMENSSARKGTRRIVHVQVSLIYMASSRPDPVSTTTTTITKRHKGLETKVKKDNCTFPQYIRNQMQAFQNYTFDPYL